MSGQLPKAIGLCTDPNHSQEFHMPLDRDASGVCPMCTRTLVIYVRTPSFVQMSQRVPTRSQPDDVVESGPAQATRFESRRRCAT